MPKLSLQNTYGQIVGAVRRSPTLFKVGAIATASAFLGGIATAWCYRETLKNLQNSEKGEKIHKSEFSDVIRSGNNSNAGTDEFEEDGFDSSEPRTLPSTSQR